MSNRKEEILIVALHLFARDGYEAVSVSQIAGELDMTKGALYRHYKSKRDIFDCIVQRMEQQDSEQARQNEVPEESIENVPEEYQNVSVEDFVGYSKSMFEYWTEDDFASSFRKMLTLEQFRNEEMQNLYQQYLVSGPAEYVEDKITKIFNAADQIQAEMIHDHLKQNGIETMSKQPGTGEYMSIAMGYSVYGTDIYVREDQKAKAEALINELLYDNDYNTFEDEDIKLPWWQNKVIAAKCILGFFILVIIIMIAMQILQ